MYNNINNNINNNSIINKYNFDKSFDKRFKESENIILKYPERKPIICLKNTETNVNIPDLVKNKFIVPEDLTLGQFIYVVRKKLKLQPEQALFLLTSNKTLPSIKTLIKELYEEHKDKDGFLYLIYSLENTFG